MQLKYSNYVAFSHDYGFAVNNSGIVLEQSVSGTKKVVASITYAPADRFFRIELSRVTEATTCGFLMISIFLYG